jgi:hypothetical protein
MRVHAFEESKDWGIWLRAKIPRRNNFGEGRGKTRGSYKEDTQESDGRRGADWRMERQNFAGDA